MDNRKHNCDPFDPEAEGDQDFENIRVADHPDVRTSLCHDFTVVCVLSIIGGLDIPEKLNNVSSVGYSEIAYIERIKRPR